MLEARHISKTYVTRGIETTALRDLSLDVEEGEFSALAGPSGSGKTTLLNILGTLDEPDAGSVSLDGVSLTELSAAELADLRLAKLGFVFQSYNLIPVLSAQENVEFVMELQGVESAERKRRALEVLAEVGLEGMAAKRPMELSGGQQQRVAVARAIVTRPRLVLADEPTANLDSHTAQQLIELMQTLNRERGVTFLFSTHDPLVMEAAGRVIRLRDGQVVAEERSEPG